jgi:hypothetical protein
MSLIQSGKTFNDGEQLTAGKLNQMFSDANLSTAGVDGTSIIVNANNVLAVRSINSSRIDSGAVITDKLPNSTVTATDGTPDGVTLPKIQHIETDKILGRTTTGDGIVETIGLNTDDAMASASATTLATDGSIKAYIDSVTIGINQTWQAVTRLIDDTTEYTNSETKPITVLVNARYIDVGNSDDLQVYMRIKPSGGSFLTLPLIDQIGHFGYSSDTGSAIIPPGSTYKFLQGSGGPTITNFQFYELR